MIGRRAAQDRSRRRGLLVRAIGAMAIIVVAFWVVSALEDVRSPRPAAAAEQRVDQADARATAQRRSPLWSLNVPIPLGARPGYGRPAPVVLSPAQELARVGRLPAGWEASVHTFAIGGRVRNYLVIDRRRDSHDARRLPVYLVLDGRNANPASMERRTALASVTGPAVLVYPSGYEDSWNAGGCCGYAHADGIDDVAFLRSVVTRVLAGYPAASPRRVYAVGFSNGGRMTYRLACDLPGMFAGIAAVEAVPVFDCSHLRPLNVEIIAQSADPLLTISNAAAPKMMQGYLEPTVQAVVTRWRSLDGCAGAASTRTLGGARIETWSCADGTRMQYTLYPGGGHRWPSGGHGRIPADKVILSFEGIGGASRLQGPSPAA
jgi:polyhydroxybutyrate depolymerase